jgi:hypothetical protein
MSVLSRPWSAMLGALAIAFFGAPAPEAEAVVPVWNGRYMLAAYADQKTGNSPAARQKEPSFSEAYDFVTSCSGGTCVATVVNGPRPTNPTIPLPLRYTWDGTRWTRIYDWQWDCFMGDGQAKVWSPARSWFYYYPQADGSLTGTWLTEIYGGPCEGSISMPVAAVPMAA